MPVSTPAASASAGLSVTVPARSSLPSPGTWEERGVARYEYSSNSATSRKG
jgi:hypothetical protein